MKVSNPCASTLVFIFKYLSQLCIKQDILATLTYFDIFNYPLTQTEIAQFLRSACCQEEFTKDLRHLISENWVYQFEEFYTLRDDYSLVPRRRKGNAQAKLMLKTAENIAGFLSAFPFVKGVAVSGSLSKNFADESSDVDFFIITERNRLWIARTFMHCFKKIAILLRKQDLFCMNYYVDEDMLQIKEKNIYTATEIATLLPLRGVKIFENFFNQNLWSKTFLPNHSLRISYVKEAKSPLFKKVAEFIFRNPLGTLLDGLLMNLSMYSWSKKTKSRKVNKRGLVMSLDASKHYAKPNPLNFQKKFIDSYEKKAAQVFCRYLTRAKTVF